MAWRSLNNPTANNGNNTLVITDDQGACCADATAETVCVITSHDIESGPIDTITIDGTNYEFAAEADTGVKLQTGINAALEAAGYFDVDSNGTFITGDNDALYIAITSSATITKLITTAPANVTFTCS